MSEFKLTAEIIARSKAKTWDLAKTEWSLAEVYEAEEPETCLCGHFPIIEICTLKNRITGQTADVGNCCVKRFIGLPSDKIFQAVKRVRKDPSKSLNGETITHAFEKAWINEWERDFYLKIMRKRVLTSKQSEKKIQINEKIAMRMQRSKT
ncbi:hypothetical protein [Burkholderia cepacia]|uniref:hypothetical protein n=1 Tax=Burkholderia cepacia TaxID=292 RepID=UPI0007535816|nr:hypothetical protein [Burkholderia cepacia]KVL10865.1 hypothetical protein WJ46_32710 [Burkholderia cepacia]KVQ33024.1 hypothetical protein WK02_10585 [Burkholderia cepacia]KVZ19149.1 hypothetical protein WL14_29285 [Burkholderia cepacia]KWB22503.1 hypothetical protein WL32_13905 [Burkholderia cepacia]